MCLHDIGASGMPLAVALFVAGLAGGVTHCAGMCGPFVLAQAGQGRDFGKIRDGGWRLERLRSYMLLPYHLGRITTYVALAYAFSSFAGFVFINSPARGVLSALMLGMAGALFLVNAVPAMAAAFPWLLRIHNIVPLRLISKVSAPLLRGQGVMHRYLLGILLGFMPCGLVMASLLAASSAQTPWQAAAAMAAFGAGTVPALAAVAAGGGLLRGRWPAAAPYFSALFVMASGASLIFIAGTLVL